MNLNWIRVLSGRIDKLHSAKEMLEMELLEAVNKHLDERKKGSLRDLAKQLGISVQYLCDIRYGRRKISKQLINRLRRL